MKCIVLLVIIVIAQYEGTTGLPRHTVFHNAQRNCEEIFVLEMKESRELSKQNIICAYLQCKWNRIQNSYLQLQKKFGDFIYGLTHTFPISNEIAPYNTKINLTQIVLTPIDIQQPTPAKIDDKEAKLPEDNKDPLTLTQDATSSEETQENGTSLAPDESTVNQKSTPIENNDKEQEQLPNVTEKIKVQKNETFFFTFGGRKFPVRNFSP